MKKIILDIDTGIDDSLALAYLLTRTDYEIAGVTTVFGNVYADTAYQNTINLLAALKKPEIKVFRGAQHQLDSDSYTLGPVKIRVHGENGIGNVVLPEAQYTDSPLMAWDFMVDCCNKYEKDLVIVAVGPMTNVVKAMQKDPEALKKVDKIVVMGGALTVPGNASKFAEANFVADPLAAKILFESGLPLVMVGLDVTHQTIITEKEIEDWASLNSTAAKALYQMSQYYYRNEANSTVSLCGCLHDPLAVEVAVNPDIITTYYPCDLTIETDGLSAGRSIGNRDMILDGPRTTNVCLRVKAKEFVDKFAKAIYDYLKSIED